MSIRGVSVHPGSAKDVMVNAIKVAAEVLAALPSDESPECTSEREGFFHPCHIEGGVGAAKLEVLNMEDGLAVVPELVENALAAIREENIEPRITARSCRYGK